MNSTLSDVIPAPGGNPEPLRHSRAATKGAWIPTLVFVHDYFERAARAQAAALGMPDLNIYVYPQHKSGDYEAEEAAKGVTAAHDLPRLLEGKY